MRSEYIGVIGFSQVRLEALNNIVMNELCGVMNVNVERTVNECIGTVKENQSKARRGV